MNLDGLNDMQKRAVKHTEGPLLIIAGAGSGKTRVLTHRIAYLIEECMVQPYNILAITFTNKAAAEMKERVENITESGNQVWVSTFHSTCVRILRRFIDRLGYDTNFTIYDTDDQKSVIKEVCKKLNIDTKMLKEKAILSGISKAKDEMITPDEMEMNAGQDYNRKRIAQAYREYQKTLKMNNALDFDDLIFKTVELLNQDHEVLDYYQERFKYIMVDEYQDTNTVQFKLISKLAAKYNNLCVVGDDDQSIYKFRGANIGNILSFENTFADAKVIKLEQNYRSTKRIIRVANQVIGNNIGRKSKALWTDNSEGDKIGFCLYEDGYKEAEGVVNSICAKVRDGWNYSDIAILYRTNAQSRLLEERLITRNVPYRLFGGVNFYQRREIKDVLAYLKTIDNGLDSQAVKRIINVPKRGIGATTIDRIQEFADANDCTFWDALVNAEHIPNIGRGYSKLEPFITMMLGFKAKAQFMSIKDLTETVIRDIGYYDYLYADEEKDEAEERIANIDEFINKIVSYENGEIDGSQIADDLEAQGADSSSKSLSGFLAEVALVADIDNLDQSTNKVVLMTLHSAKGLEFPIVYMTGLEDGLFPSYMTIMADDPDEVEEERRLCYVGITRAQQELYISSAKQRMMHGETQMNKVSRFVHEMPKEDVEITNQATGYNKSKIDFGGVAAEGSEGRHDFRVSAKSTLSRYGGGTVTNYGQSATRVKIEGKSTSKPSYYSNTSYGARRTMTDYSAAKNVSAAQPNKKVGFGKEFPMGIFDLKKPDTVEKTTMPVTDSSSEKGGLGYAVGDMVSHVKFGSGKVLAIDNATKDYMVTVEFADYGVKKMLAGFAKLKKQ